MSKRESHRQALHQVLDRFIGSIDARVDAWHESDSNLPLHAYLCMTEEAYAAWVRDADSIDEAAVSAALKANLIDEILRINERFNYNPSLDEALNSGNGTYKP